MPILIRVILFVFWGVVLSPALTLGADPAKQVVHAPYANPVSAISAAPAIYLAGPLFTEAEKQWWKKTQHHIQKRLPKARVLWPGEFFTATEIESWGNQAMHEIFLRCRNHLAQCDIVIALMDGPMVDDGTAWELGYYYALKRGPIFGLRTDFRNGGDTKASVVNAMLAGSANAIFSDLDKLLDHIEALQAK